jgi:undecaprenyl-diphosphatase
MFDSILWGLIQGLTEFLPISSSGHLVLVPALLGREGPDLATSAMLHLGTLAAVLAYYRSDVAGILRFDRPGRRLLTLLVIGTIPAVVLGLAFESKVEELIDNPRVVAGFLIVTGVVLLSTLLLRPGSRTVADVTPKDSGLIGLAQATALIPGISRSGMTISTGMARGLNSTEAARFAFLLGIPAIAGAGLLSVAEMLSDGVGITLNIVVGTAVAAVAGYFAIALLIRLLARVGLAPFGIYCLFVGGLSLIVL